ncbi:MAG: hypothetical protein ACOC12_08795 [Bacteroidota bacterium]
MSTGFLLQFLTLAGGLTQSPFTGKKPCQALIVKTRRADLREFRGVFINHLPEPFDGSYTLEAVEEKHGTSTVTRVQGAFTAKGNSKVKLSRMALQHNDEVVKELVLKIYSHGLCICSHSLNVRNPAMYKTEQQL